MSQAPPEKMLKAVVLKGKEIAKSGKNLLVSGWNSLWKAKAGAEGRRLKDTHFSKLMVAELEQTELLKILARGIEEARHVKDSLEKPTHELGEGSEGIEPAELALALKKYREASAEAQASEKSVASDLLQEVIWKLEDVHQDCQQALRKLKENARLRNDLEKELQGVSLEECQFRIGYQEENDRLLSKEIQNFSKQSDDNIRDVVRAFVAAVAKVGGAAVPRNSQ